MMVVKLLVYSGWCMQWLLLGIGNIGILCMKCDSYFRCFWLNQLNIRVGCRMIDGMLCVVICCFCLCLVWVQLLLVIEQIIEELMCIVQGMVWCLMVFRMRLVVVMLLCMNGSGLVLLICVCSIIMVLVLVKWCFQVLGLVRLVCLVIIFGCRCVSILRLVVCLLIIISW